MKKAVLLLVAILAWPIGAQAITGNELLAECRSREPRSRGYCLGLIVGAAHAAGLVRMIAPQPIPGEPDFSTLGGCTPDGVTFGQTRDIVVRFLEQSPAKRHEDFGFLVLEALQLAFPCRPGRR
ncbi:MAG: Rap1a/Tai family immunity protein [Aquidulcibacter sp.]